MGVFVIAEIGINHNGDLNLAKKMIDTAVIAGADAVKFQKRDIDLVYTTEFLKSERASPWGHTQRDQKSGLEFGLEEYDQINDYCASRGIEWFASSWDINSQILLRRYNCKYNKVASAMILDRSLLSAIASEGKHTFISTGMSTIEEIEVAVDIFRKSGCSFELMHCVSTYPMSVEDANLKVIETLRERFGCDVGYSGHETGLSVTLGAVAFGATSVERHITLDRAMYGSDQSASLEPAGFIQLVGGIRNVEAAIGDGVKRVSDQERVIADKLRAHIEC